LYWDAANSRPAANNPWFNATAPHSAIKFGNDFNHESMATRKFVKDVLKFWMQEYRIDGYRFDFTKGFTQKASSTDAAMSAQDDSRIAILKDYNSYIRSIDPNAYVILEHLCSDEEEKILAAEGMMLWNNLNHSFMEASMGWLTNSNLNRGIYTTHGFTQADGLVSYMESHDEERMMYKNLQYGNAAGNYTVRDLNIALKRQELCAAFLFAMPGPKMIWQFGELGYDISIDHNGRTGEKPLLWDYNKQAARLSLKNAFARFIALKKNNSIFKSNNILANLNGAVKYIKLSEGANTFVVVGNFDVNAQPASIDMGNAGTWYDMANNSTITLTGNNYNTQLAPGEYHIFSKALLQ